MKYLNLIIILYVFFVGCNNKTDTINNQDKTKKQRTEYNTFNVPYTALAIAEFPDTLNQLEEQDKYYSMALNCLAHQGGITRENIQKIKLLRNVNINNFGKVKIIEGVLWGDNLSNLVYKNFYLLYNDDRKEAACFLLNDYKLIKLKETDPAYYFAGSYFIKGKGYFFIYDYLNGNFNKIFDTGFDDPEKALYSYKFDLECISYKDSALLFKNSKENGDDYLDLNFNGIIQYFCKPNQYGNDRENSKPIFEKEINVSYLTAVHNGHPQWVISDSNYINLLH